MKEQNFSKIDFRRRLLIWFSLAVGLMILGVNKQLDVQSWLTAVIKAVAWEQGWYALGQQAQVYFLAGFGVFGTAGVVLLGWFVRRDWRRYGLVLLGCLFILRFVFVRIGAFYGIPLPGLSRFTAGLRLNWLLEPAGVIAIALAALFQLWGHFRFPAVQRRSSSP